jgi:hypothetical protein
MIGAVLLLPLLLIESDFSLVFGGLPLNAIALGTLWFFLTRSAGSASVTRSPGPRLTHQGPARAPAASVAASSRIVRKIPGQ